MPLIYLAVEGVQTNHQPVYELLSTLCFVLCALCSVPKSVVMRHEPQTLIAGVYAHRLTTQLKSRNNLLLVVQVGAT